MANVQRVPPDLGVDDVVLLVPEEETVPEHDLHRLLVDQLAAGVRAWFAGHDDVAVHSRLAWFPDRSDTRVRLDPDVMVVHGRPQGERKSFKSWVEGGAVPQVILEVRSEDAPTATTSSDCSGLAPTASGRW
jgi:Uma2 family endonuclease